MSSLCYRYKDLYRIHIDTVKGSISSSIPCTHGLLVGLRCYHFNGPCKWRRQGPSKRRHVQGMLGETVPLNWFNLQVLLCSLGSLRNHDGNGNCNAMLLLFQNFRFKRFLVFCSNLLPLRVSEVVLFNFTTWKSFVWRSVLWI